MTVKRYNAGCAYAGEEEMVQVDGGAYVSHEDYAALLKERDALARELCMSEAKCKGLFSDAVVASLKCDAMAAENAAFKGEIANMVFMPDDDFFSSTKRVQEIIGRLVNAKTPSTDAAIANIQAQGVEKYGNLTIKIGEEEKDSDIIYAGQQALLFAAQLRKESNHD